MRRRLVALLLAGLVLAGAGWPGDFAVKQRPGRSTDLPRPRDGDVAVKEELEAARRLNTVAAYDLFLARHGENALAAVARRERAALRHGGR